MKKIILIAAFMISSIMIVNAGDHQYTIGEKVSFKSDILNEERTILVYLPATYNLSDAEYPVLYLLDGGYHFHHTSGIVQFLSSNGLIPEMIVVGITNVDRNRDFTPTNLSQRPSSGGAEKFSGFIAEELFPFMERNYRVQSYNVLMGHSLGGTFATYALLNNPEMFSSYISISPYLMYDNNIMVRETQDKLKSKYPEGTSYYMTVGNEPNYFEALDQFEKSIEEKSPKGLDFKYIQMLDDDHGSVPHLSIYNGLLFIYDGWKLDAEKYQEGLAAVDQHYKNLSKKYGYEITTPEYIINLLGYNYLTNEDIENAISVFLENVNRFPNSANVYDSLGEAYEKNGQLDKAETNYAKSVEIAEKKKHPNLKIYQQNLTRVQEK
ncbi:MAG: alpha/beta fold hydrolase [Bacteroidetes bacterium]|nr:alpha/beta fold hydrolase [Bacteroidota bacterium]